MDLNEALVNIATELNKQLGMDKCVRLPIGAFLNYHDDAMCTTIRHLGGKVRKTFFSCGLERTRIKVGYRLPWQRPVETYIDLYAYKHRGTVYYTIMLLRADQKIDHVPEVRDALRRKLLGAGYYAHS